MNLVILSGRLTKDPEVRYTASQMAVATFTLAVDRIKKGDEKSADFFRITVFDKQAENCERFLSKGAKTLVRGRLTNNEYTNKEGQTVRSNDVIADNVEFLDTKKAEKTEEPSKSGFAAINEDVPF